MDNNNQNWYIECGGVYTINGQKVFGRNIRINIFDNQKLNSIYSRFNNIDVYSTNYIYNNENQNESDIIGPLYLDFDIELHGEENFNKVKTDVLIGLSFLKNIMYIPSKYIKIYFSGNKGFHVIISNSVFGIQPCKDLNEKYKQIAKSILEITVNKTVDTKIYDKKRLIRMPHTINGKTGLYKVPITEECLRNYNYQDMIEYAKTDKDIVYEEPIFIEKAALIFNEKSKVIKPIRNNTSKPIINPNYEIPICIKNVFKYGAEKGQRNNTLILLASSILQKGVDIDECIDLLLQWNDKNLDPLPEHEVIITIKSAYKGLMEGRKYGCSAAKDLGLCIGKECKLYKNK